MAKVIESSPDYFGDNTPGTEFESNTDYPFGDCTVHVIQKEDSFSSIILVEGPDGEVILKVVVPHATLTHNSYSFEGEKHLSFDGCVFRWTVVHLGHWCRVDFMFTQEDGLRSRFGAIRYESDDVTIYLNRKGITY